MIPVSSAARCRDIDRGLIEGIGVSGLALMETASRGVADVVRGFSESEAGVVVVCGAGNNGGDGYAAARWLHSWGIPVRIWKLAEPIGDAAVQHESARRLGIPEVHGLGDAGLVVDAVFGTGLSRPVSGVFRDAIEAMDAHPAPKVAVDLPSGLHADTGAVLGACARAAATVTFGHAKLGFYGEPGADLVGRVVTVDLGQGPVPGDAEIPEIEDVRRWWPRRSPGDHKNRSGHLLIVAGSLGMAGAAALSARGALAAGVGLLTVATPRDALPRLSLPAEAMWVELEDLPSLLEKRTGVAAGPGLGGGGSLGPTLAAELTEIWRSSKLPLVYDADALPCAQGPGRGERVITPHPAEAARIVGSTAADVQSDRFRHAANLGDDRVALLKGRNTLIASPGMPTAINPRNSPVLATGGAGDVLTGVIGALLARGIDGRKAAILAAWVHGSAAELLAARRSQGWTATDIAAAIPDAVEVLASR